MIAVATERIYRTEDGRYVPHAHPEAAFLVVGVGGPVPADFTGFADGTPVVPEAPADAPADPVEAAFAEVEAEQADAVEEQAPEAPAEVPAKKPRTPKG